MFTIKPIITSKANLSGFYPLYEQSEINHADAKRNIHDIQKVAELTGFNRSILQHFSTAFAFSLPPQIIFEIQNLGLPFVFSTEFGFPAAEGIISGTYLTWFQFFQNVTKLSEPTLKLARALFDSEFRLIPYFGDFKW